MLRPAPMSAVRRFALSAPHGCGGLRCCAGGAQSSKPPWAERREYREQLPGRDQRIRSAERMVDGTPLDGVEVSQELRFATSQVSSLGRQRKWEEALAVYAAFPEPDAVLRSATVDACARSLQLAAARQVFAEMPKKNLGAYTSLINLLGRLKRVHDAEGLLREMQQESIQPDGFVYSSIVMAYGAAGDVDSALRVFRQRQQAVPPSKVAFGAIMSACSKNGELELARSLLSELEAAQLQPDVEHFTSVMAACVRRRDEASAREAFAEMRQRGLRPDVIVYTTLIAAIAVASGQDAVAKAEALLAEMEQEGLTADSFVFDAILNAALQAGDTERFHFLVAEMNRRGLSPTQASQRKIQIMNERHNSFASQSASIPASSGALPPGWLSTLDPRNGRHYYWNEKDPAKTTTWERPAE